MAQSCMCSNGKKTIRAVLEWKPTGKEPRAGTLEKDCWFDERFWENSARVVGFSLELEKKWEIVMVANGPYEYKIPAEKIF